MDLDGKVPVVKKEWTMATHGRLAALVLAGIMVALPASTSEAEIFYAGGLPVYGCPENATYQDGNCTLFQTQAIVPATPIDAWVAAQVSHAVANLRTHNENLQKQVDELAARVRALEAALNRSRPGAAPK